MRTVVDEAIEQAADIAVATGCVVVSRQYQFAAVPDLIAIEAYADNIDLPATRRLYRTDGRVVCVFSIPSESDPPS